jgi:hypothetical protein
MAVVTVSTFTVKPDRFEDQLEEARKFKAVFERSGGKNIRFLAAMVAGEATGSLTFIVESDDFAGNGAVMDKLLADPEGQALMAAAATSASPTVPGYQTTVWVDVPL